MKTNLGLVEFVKKALAEKWGYVWGTFGQILTQALFDYKLTQYPDGVGNYRDFIQRSYINKRCADCVGLIKAYMWWSGNDPVYIPASDVSANGMYSVAKEKGPMSTMPDIPGICLWLDGHIGVYIGNGQVIESHGTKYGVIQTPLRGAGATGWTNWLKCPYITYEDVLSVGMSGDAVKALQQKLIKIGYQIDDDGIFGTGETQPAVIKFQQGNGLPATGMVDKATMAAIDAMVAKLEAPKKKDYKQIIMENSNGSGADWIKCVDSLVAAAQAPGSLGDLEIGSWLPQLIEKLGNK